MDCNVSTSEISGNPSMVTVESAKIAAGSRATALFFAPFTLTVPDNFRPPSTIIFSILNPLFTKNKPHLFIVTYFTFAHFPNLVKTVQFLYLSEDDLQAVLIR